MGVTGPTCDCLHFRLAFSRPFLLSLAPLSPPQQQGGAVCPAVVPGPEGCPAHWSPTELGAGLPWPAERGPRQRKACLSREAAGLALLHKFQCPRPFRLLRLAWSPSLEYDLLDVLSGDSSQDGSKYPAITALPSLVFSLIVLGPQASSSRWKSGGES